MRRDEGRELEVGDAPREGLVDGQQVHVAAVEGRARHGPAPLELHGAIARAQCQINCQL